MGMSDSSRKSAIALILKGKPESDESESEGEDSVDSSDEALQSAMSDLKQALNDGDMKAASAAFRDAMDICRD
jgi:predicted lipoprotein